ncbi:Protein LIPS-7 a [Aphelenchoides avenae]|nr:Protein LIPS-7 a [Aphelenchus avenae]KAH7716543.1 Protein LIPS-7 a [Aphelenchus avenae]
MEPYRAPFDPTVPYSVPYSTEYACYFKLPVVFVHGSGGTAEQAHEPMAYFRERGYGDQELYATTYGVDGDTDSMRCVFVRQVRSLIVAVSNYTDSPVKVIAFSMGGPVSRKAILGGTCVDTVEDLGTPLTSSVRSYVTVGGPNRGAAYCLDHADEFKCNLVNGMHCQSKFIKNINER